jgi:hypothetical protein
MRAARFLPSNRHFPARSDVPGYEESGDSEIIPNDRLAGDGSSNP